MPFVTYIGRRGLAGDVLGENLISNGHFTDDTTGWTGSSATLSTRANGNIRVTNDSSGSVGRAYQIVTTVTGTLYRVDYEFTFGTSVAGTTIASTSISSVGFLATDNAKVTDTTGHFYFIAESTTTYIILLNGSITTSEYGEWDNVKCREVTVRGHATDIQHVAGGTFSYDKQWGKGTGWTINGGIALCDGTQVAVSNLTQQSSGPGARYQKTYDTSFDLTGYSAGNIRFFLASHGAGTARTANGTYTEQITADTISTTHIPTILLQGDVDFVGNLNNIVVTLAADNTWSLDFDLADPQPGRDQDVRSNIMLNGARDTNYIYSKKTLTCRTTIMDYGTWQFFEEFGDSAMDGQTITFDPFGTETQPKSPGSYVLTDWTLSRVLGADTTERRQYTFTVREV